ncbi:MAG: transglutaminase-like cysteine peptidase [Bauldia sp.]
MRIGTWYKSGLISAILCLSAGYGEAAGPAAAPFMSTAGRTSQPIGHFEFCQVHPRQCAVRTGAAKRVRLTPELWNQLVGINAAINGAIAPATDREIFGREEVWSYPGQRGDCEDVALEKQRELIGDGWPVSALLMTVVRKRNGEGHAVLTVATDRGDLVLDNLDPRVLLWSETAYRFVKRQSEFDSGQWTAIDDVRTSSVGSLER